jgi:hypothetical protein
MAFVTVHSEGGLLPPDLLARIANRDKDLSHLTPEAYGLPPSERLNEAVSRAWARARAYWSAYQETLKDPKVSASRVAEVRSEWLLPLFRCLGYGDLTFNRSAEQVGDRSFTISHRAGADPADPPIHIVSPLQWLERSAEESGKRTSPHGLLQDYLNRSDRHLWGIVTNGHRLRLLRDNLSLSRAAYLEFDLEAMFEGGAYADFLLLYLLLHRSRLPRAGQSLASCPLEQWRDTAQRQGTRALDSLRVGVETAIKCLGRGLLQHPANEQLRAKLRDGELDVTGYYRQLLRLVYRMLFLVVAEERDLLFPPPEELSAEQERPGRSEPDAASGGIAVLTRDRTLTSRLIRVQRSRHIYGRCYSITRLREIADRHDDPSDRHDDLWRSLQVAFSLMRGESETLDIAALDLPTLGVGLFDDSSCPDLDRALAGNPALIAAVRGLSQVTMPGTRVTRRINYRDMDVEELGSVYESLLDYHPVIRWLARDTRPQFEFVQGSERKTTGSYYTPRALVDELIKSALDPVIAGAFVAGRTREQKRANLLALAICDPACGSGHFLLAAARRLGRAVAQLDYGEGEPDPAALRAGTREAIRHCIYGVDVNPLAVDLCKLGLWIEGHTPGKALMFLGHRIKCGNSLIGATRALVEAGIPDEAFSAVTGDDKALAAVLKKRNRAERKSEEVRGRGRVAVQHSLQEAGMRLTASQEEVAEAEAIAALPDDSTQETGAKRGRQAELDRMLDAPRLPADTWTAAFFWTLCPGQAQPPTQAELRAVRLGLHPLEASQREGIRATVAAVRAFHWHLEYPEVFGAGGEGGFDCLLGNPPWERIKLQEQEFFGQRDPEIAGAANKAARARLIGALTVPRPGESALESARRMQLAREFEQAKHTAKAESKFARSSGRFPLTGVGDVNTYALFAEQFRSLTASNGRAGFICPTGLATDDTTKDFFADIVARRSLVSLYGFKNEEFLFPKPVEHTVTFALVTLLGARLSSPTMEFTWFAYNADHMNNPTRRHQLSPDDIALLNPNTRTSPVFRTEVDAALTKAIYRRVPLLVNERTGENPWGVQFQAMFHMSNDSGLFRDAPAPDLVPLYEAKLLHQFDHRWASYEGATARELTNVEKADPRCTVTPRYWVPRREVEARLAGRWDRGWLLGFRDIARSTDERTAIFSLLPRVAVGNKIPLLVPMEVDSRYMCCLVASFNSLVQDFCARQKVGGTTLNFFIVRQFPVLPPEHYTAADLDFIVPRVLELVYTAWDMQPFVRDLGYQGPPFAWDEKRRALLRAELDACYARLYGLNRKQLRYILDPAELTDRELADILDPWEDQPEAPRTTTFPGETFRVLKQREIKQYGEYRTRRLVLEAWDRLGTAAEQGILESAHI